MPDIDTTDGAKVHTTKTGLHNVTLGQWFIRTRQDGGLCIEGPEGAFVESIYRGRNPVKYQASRTILVPGPPS